jgi:hypothetical protein
MKNKIGHKEKKEDVNQLEGVGTDDLKYMD